jgi:hypothetical protein
LVTPLAAPSIINQVPIGELIPISPPTDEVIAAFGNLTKSGNVTRQKLRDYLERFFAGPGNEFEKWDASDWNPK